MRSRSSSVRRRRRRKRARARLACVRGSEREGEQREAPHATPPSPVGCPACSLLIDIESRSLFSSAALRVAPLVTEPVQPYVEYDDADNEALQQLFAELDTDGNGFIDFDELKRGLRRLNVHPRKLVAGEYGSNEERWSV